MFEKSMILVACTRKTFSINKCQGPALALCRSCPSTWRTPPKGFWTIHRLEVVHRLAILACSSVWSCWDCTERLSCRDPGPQSRRQQTGAALGRHCSLQMLRGFRARSDARWKPLRGHLPTPGRDARESLGMSIFPCLDGKPPGPHGQPQRTLQTLLLLDGPADMWQTHVMGILYRPVRVEIEHLHLERHQVVEHGCGRVYSSVLVRFK